MKDKYKKTAIISLVIAISGFIGWLYEYIFYYFNGGMKEFYWRGGNFLPWINIYAIGAILILITTKKFEKKPLLVFLISVLVTGVLEYVSGYLIYVLQDGARYWDYNTEILNFGNIDGFVCLRSVLYKITKNTKKCMVICIIIASLFILDELYNLLLHNIFNTPTAIEIYKSIGFKFM